jgi:opine dehydrogenase
MKVCVVGCGDAGIATAGDLALRGHEVSLLELEIPQEDVEGIRSERAIQVEYANLSDRKSGWAGLRKVSLEPAEVLADTEIIIVTVLSRAHGGVIRDLVPHLTDGQTILFMPGSFGSSIRFFLATQSVGRRIRVGEAAGLIYTARKENNIRVRIDGYKRGLPLSAYPSADTSAFLSLVSQLYPDVKAGVSVLATGLSNLNLVCHPPILVTSASRVEAYQGDFLFYIDGATPSVVRVVEALDAERLAVSAAYGIPLPSAAELISTWYADQGARGASLYETIHSVPPYRSTRGPATFTHRYFTEDVSFGLVPMARLAAARDVPTPITLALTDLASLLVGQDLRIPSVMLDEPGVGQQTIFDLLTLV